MPLSASARPRGHRHPGPLGQRGATTLEFALVGALLVSLIFGGIEASRYEFTVESVRMATAEAVRLATLRGSQNLNARSAACTNLAGSLTGVAALVPFLNPASLSVTMSGCATAGGITTVAISVQYPFSFTVSFFGATSRPIAESAQAIFN